jgi:hypothetical protein
MVELFDFGVDEDGEPFRTFIVSAELSSGEGQRSRKKTDRQELALRALAEVALSGGREPQSPCAIQAEPSLGAPS